MNRPEEPADAADPTNPPLSSESGTRYLTLDDPAVDHARVLSARARRFLAHAEHSGVDRRNIWGAFDERGRLAQVALLTPQAGRAGLLFVSRPEGPEETRALGDLVRHVCGAHHDADVDFVQAIVGTDDDQEYNALIQAGFRELATLCYMRYTTPRSITEPVVPAGVTFETWAPDRRDRFLLALDRTYEQTLDCPDLRGVRRTEDVLAGHMATGRFEPELWTLMSVDAVPAGLALLNPVPEAACIELTYLGLARLFRRRRLGSLLLRYALWRGASAGHRNVTLAMDERNTPAARLYGSLGFTRAARKRVLIKQVRDSRAL